MGMGNYPDYADTVAGDFVKEICPEEYHNFHQKLGELDIPFDDFCDYIFSENELTLEENEQEALDQCYDALSDAFNDKTGLELYVVYHNAEDRGDELDGGSWAVTGVYQLTPAGEKYKNKIYRKCWTYYG